MVVYNSVSQTDPDTQRIIAYPKGGGVYLPSRVLDEFADRENSDTRWRGGYSEVHVCHHGTRYE